MKRKALVWMMIAALVMGSLAGCGKTAATTESSAQKETAAASAPETAKEEAAQAAPAEEKETETPAPAEATAAEEAEKEAAPAETPEESTPEPAAETPEPAEEAEETVEEITPIGNPVEMAAYLSQGFLGGGLKPVEDVPEPEDLTAEQQEQMDRAMRDYTPSADTLLKNKAEIFYYYSQMDEDAQAMYDAMMMVCEDPANPDNVTKAVVSVDPYSYDFADVFYAAYYGMLYDHAELFWLYNGIEADMCIYVPYENNAPEGMYEVYFGLDRTYDNYETQMKAFNKAVKSFLKKIDTTKSAPEIVKQVHNKLVNQVTYNTPVSTDNSQWGYCNFAHTAYGALVADSDGNEKYAVCDGYSQAFVYLLQQLGFNAAVIVGIAGPDAYSTGGHAWSVVELDGDWYEIDSTWDDPGSLEESIEAVRALDEFSYNYFREAFDDKDYAKKCRYYLYNLTTDEISYFEPDEYYNYYSKDGQFVYSLLGSSVHIRASEDTWGYEDYGVLMDLAPIATGTIYAMR